MKTQHTQGEWKKLMTLKVDQPSCIIAGNKKIANIINAFENRTEAEANAKLIAAAPELLKIVQRLLDNERQYAGAANLIIDAKEAIKKATE